MSEQSGTNSTQTTPAARSWKSRLAIAGFYLLCTLALAAFMISGGVYFGFLPDPSAEAPNQASAQPTGFMPEDLLDQSVLPLPPRDRILSDASERLNEKFRIPVELQDRVGFWFDVYTKYDSNQRIVLHEKYPWIIFKVIDVAPIVGGTVPSHRWMRNQKADEIVRDEVYKIRKALRTMAARRDPTPQNDIEKSIVTALMPLHKGSSPLSKAGLKKLIKESVRSVRVQTGQKNFFIAGLETSQRYLPMMEEIFHANHLPIELTRIPLVESSFNRQAASRVGAIGIWQFMADTGQKFLVINNRIDERISPFKESEAAADLLKENFQILHHSWPLAVTAWNHGTVGMKRAILQAHSRNLGTIIANYRSRSFDFASMNFYAEFLAALHAERYSDEIFGHLTREPALDLASVRLPRAAHFLDVLKASGLGREEFITFNPDIAGAAFHNSLLPAGFGLRLPAQARAGILRQLAGRDRSAPEKKI